MEQVTHFAASGSRNMIPLGRPGSRNTRKVMKSKPRGLDEEIGLNTYSKTIHPDIQMDDIIWAKLPKDLLNEILARVPPFVILRLRSVCKRWNSILQDNNFLKFHSQVQSHHGPSCLFTLWKNARIPQYSVYSMPLKQWYRMPFNFLPQWATWLVGSSGGLVCVAGFDDDFTFRIIVCNPITQAWRILPSMHSNQQRQMILVVDQIDRSFKVIANNDIYEYILLPTEVYDSKFDHWTVHQIMPTVNLGWSKMVVCDSRLYLDSISPLGLMTYGLDTGCWEHIPAKFPRLLLDWHLVAGNKKLFLVGRIGIHCTLHCILIWEFDHTKVGWVEITRMPPRYYRGLFRLSAGRFRCFGQDNLICFTSWKQGKGLIYEVEKKVWSWIGGCVIQPFGSQVALYEPRFDDSIY